MGQQQRVKHFGMVVDYGIWRKLWSLNVPPKVWMFVWRACLNILSTQDNLHCRKININPRCEICCQHLESTAYLLWECPLAQNVWALLPRTTSKNVQMWLKISSCYLEGWWTNFLNKSWKDGQWWFGQFGMLEINIILNISKFTLRPFLMGHLVFYRSINVW